MGLVAYLEAVCKQDAYGLPHELTSVIKQGMLEFLASNSPSAYTGLTGQGAGGEGGSDGAPFTLP